MGKKKGFMALAFSLMTVLIILFCVGCGSSNNDDINKPEENRVEDSNKVNSNDVDAKANKTESLSTDSKNSKSERAIIGEDITVAQEKKTSKTNVVTQKNKNNITLVIDKSEYILEVVKDGQVVNTYPIAVGKNPGQKQRSGDLKTPTGDFAVDEIINAKPWTHDFHDGKGVINGAYGPWFISLNTGGWSGIGIHGTHDDSSIGKMVSEGCIRMHNNDVDELKRIVTVGTEVLIKE